MTDVWDKVQELMECIESGELSYEEAAFIENLFQHLDPHNPEDELSEEQIKYLFFLHDRHCNGDDVTWDDYEIA